MYATMYWNVLSPDTTLLPCCSHLSEKGPLPVVAWQPIDITATALSCDDIGACVSGSSAGRHGRQHMACDSGTRPPPLNCKTNEKGNRSGQRLHAAVGSQQCQDWHRSWLYDMPALQELIESTLRMLIGRGRTQEPSRSKLEMNQPSFSQDRPFGDPVAFSHSQIVISVLTPPTARQSTTFEESHGDVQHKHSNMIALKWVSKHT